MDRIEYYSDEEVEKWFKAFDALPDYVNYLKGIPFSYREVQREYYRREMNKQTKGDFKADQQD